jgi:flagellar hook-associated protein 2
MASIDGLSSGIATSDLINQLMRLERMPQVRLQTERSKVVRMNSLYNEINRQMAAISTAAKAVTGTNGWDSAKASSSDTSRVAVTASATAPAASLTFTVDQLAKAGSLVSAGTAAGKDAVVVDAAATPTVYLTKDGTETAVGVGDGKLSTIVANINAAGAGITASAVNVGDTDNDGTDEYRLQLASTTTGASSDITVSDTTGGAGMDPFTTSLGGMNTLVAGANAVLQVGGAGGYAIERQSNTFSDVLDGVTFTLAKADPAADVTVTVEGDTGAIADRVSRLVDAANAALTGMAKHQAYDADTKSAGPLMGDSMVRRLRSGLIGAASDAVAGIDIASPGLAGVEVQRDGTLKFDRAKFTEQYEKDPAAVQAVLGAGTGVAGRLEALAANAKIQIDATVKSRTDRLPGIDNRIASWDQRLEIREQTLRRQFEGMEVALGRMQQQSQWLAGQLAGLPMNSGGN